MKRIIIILITLISILASCSQGKDSNKDEYTYIEVGSFNYALGTYKIKFQTNTYFILLNENDYYYLLEDVGKVKSKLDYFNNRTKIIENPVELDSATFSNFKNQIVFIDSCDKAIVHEWVQKIENNPKSLNKPIKIDTTVNFLNINNIYYSLIQDSFKIFEDDAHGDYILSR